MSTFVRLESAGPRSNGAAVDEDGNVQTKVNWQPPVTLVSGTEPPNPAVVDSEGKLFVKAFRPVVVVTANTGGEVVHEESGELVPPTEGREALHIFNTGGSRIHYRFGGSASTDCPWLDPGESVSFEVVGEEAVAAMAVEEDGTAFVTEFKRA